MILTGTSNFRDGIVSGVCKCRTVNCICGVARGYSSILGSSRNFGESEPGDYKANVESASNSIHGTGQSGYYSNPNSSGLGYTSITDGYSSNTAQVQVKPNIHIKYNPEEKTYMVSYGKRAYIGIRYLDVVVGSTYYPDGSIVVRYYKEMVLSADESTLTIM